MWPVYFTHLLIGKIKTTAIYVPTVHGKFLQRNVQPQGQINGGDGPGGIALHNRSRRHGLCN